MIKPGDLELEEFRRVGHQVIDAIAEYHEGLERGRCCRAPRRAEVAALFAGDFAEEGEPAEALLADWRERVRRCSPRSARRATSPTSTGRAR